MAYKDCRCNDSKCQESKPHWECTNCGALNCKHASISCSDCGKWRIYYQKPEPVSYTFWSNYLALKNKLKK
jgi:hypothetical protein